MSDKLEQASSAGRRGRNLLAAVAPSGGPGQFALGGARNTLEQAGNMAVLLAQLCKSVAHNPRGFWGDVRDQVADMTKRTFVPATITVIGYGTLVVTFAVVVLLFLGAPNRLGAVYLSFVLRETAPYLTGIVIAGVLGTALTSELGARKVREELDALRALGQDPIRLLVLPRVIAMIIVTTALFMYMVIFEILEGLAGTIILGDTSAGAFASSFMVNLTVPDVLGSAIKMSIIGLFIGVVCASKGLGVSAGAEGVGRAVNQAVVISVLGVFIISILFNMILLGLTPDMRVLR